MITDSMLKLMVPNIHSGEGGNYFKNEISCSMCRLKYQPKFWQMGSLQYYQDWYSQIKQESSRMSPLD